MKNIDKAIPYNWTLGWKYIGQEKPIVNLLLKALLEKNINEIEKLEREGASLRECDKKTLQRVIFHVANNYPIMKWLVDHGMSRIANDIDEVGDNGINGEECISDNGDICGIAARACLLKAYDVFDLLCANGFSDFCFFSNNGKRKYVDFIAFETGNETVINILLSNGYIITDKEYYERYVLSRKQIKRKSIGLDDSKWGKIPSPKYEDVPLIFGRKEVLVRNIRIREDYEDRIRAHNEFINKFGRKRWEKYVMEKDSFMIGFLNKLSNKKNRCLCIDYNKLFYIV